jgi:hypothetical protein
MDVMSSKGPTVGAAFQQPFFPGSWRLAELRGPIARSLSAAAKLSSQSTTQGLFGLIDPDIVCPLVTDVQLSDRLVSGVPGAGAHQRMEDRIEAIDPGTSIRPG